MNRTRSISNFTSEGKSASVGITSAVPGKVFGSAGRYVAGPRKEMWKSCNRRIKVAELNLNWCQRVFSCGLVDRVRFVILDRLLGLFERFLLLAKPGISQSKSRRTIVRIGRHDRVSGRLN